jgi:hypothetical protein
MIIKELTRTGQEEKEMTPVDALKYILQKVSAENLWLYINGTVKDVNTLTADDLITEPLVTLGNQIIGG